MKVLHLMNSLKPSGMERMFVSAAPYFQEFGIETLIVGQGQNHPFRSELEAADFRTFTVPPLKTLAGMRAFSRLIASERPDIVHIHTEGAFGLAALIAKITIPKLGLVRTVHSLFRPAGRGKIKRRVESFIVDRLTGEFISVSADVQANESNFGRKSTLVYNWVEDRFFELRGARVSTPPATRRSVVIVGNCSPIKNHQIALTGLYDAPLDLYFHGDESGANAVEVQILDALEKEGRLLHRGTGDPAASLVAADVYAMPSTHEGMGIALAEALVVGTPAFISDAPGLTWAADFANVTVLRNDVDVWKNHFDAFAAAELADEAIRDLPIDLSAKRGAGEYVAVYHRVYGRA